MKTKKQLLKAMFADEPPTNYRRACSKAVAYVNASKHRSAMPIGLECRTDWALWFLYRALTIDGRALLATRLGISVNELWQAGMVSELELSRALDRNVIDDCWRAWCRSGSKP